MRINFLLSSRAIPLVLVFHYIKKYHLNFQINYPKNKYNTNFKNNIKPNEQYGILCPTKIFFVQSLYMT